MGGVRIEFINSENNIIETKTDIYGYFSITLEPKKYNILLKDYTLKLTENSDKIYDFKSEKKIEFLILESEFKNGFISGRTVDNLNNSISFSTITVNSGEFTQNIISDEFGYFSLEIPYGIFRISTYSEGFSTKSVVRNLSPASSIPNLIITMNRLLYSIEGYVTDSVEPLKNIEVKLISEKGQILKRVNTSENGKFNFVDIPSLEHIYISIESDKYINYYSKPIQLEKNIRNFYIPLVRIKGKTL